MRFIFEERIERIWQKSKAGALGMTETGWRGIGSAWAAGKPWRAWENENLVVEA